VSRVEPNILRPASFDLPAKATSHEIHDLSAKPGWAAAWDALATTPMQQYCWARACASAFSTTNKLRVITVGPADRPTALAPLIERGQPVTQLELLGLHELYEPMDLLYADADALDALLAQLVETGCALRLGRVPAASPTLAAFDQRGQGCWPICWPDCNDAQFVSCAKG
jgi:hypothetical protein